MSNNSKNLTALQHSPWGRRTSFIVQIWIFISLSISYSSGQDNSSLISSGITYSTMEVVNQTLSVNASDIHVTATINMTRSSSVPVYSTPPLPSNCYHVCVCNHSVVYSTASMAYNMTENATQSMAQMTQSLNMTTASVNMTQTLNMTTASVSMTQSLEMSSNITLSVSPAPSSVNMSYTASVNATTMSHNSSVWPSSSVSAPFVCRSNESCWVEVECRTHSPGMSMTRYVTVAPTRSSAAPVSSSVAPTEPPCLEDLDCHDSPGMSMTRYVTVAPTRSSAAPVSSSVAPTEPPCLEDLDCHGDCDGSAYMDCDVCIEGNTGVASFRDCAEECNGTAQNASCGVCLPPGKPNPALDCNNECLSDAMFDDCQVCIGGSTGLTANYLKDACGVCNGTNSTCAGCDGIPNSGKVKDACGVCDGDGTTCTDIMKTEPRTIASCQPRVLVTGAGLNDGVDTVCALYDPVSGDMVVNTTASARNVTHARCEFQPWDNYTAGVYNLSVTVVHNDKPKVKTNTSLQVYYYSCPDLSLTSVTPNEVLLDELPQYVTLVGSGFIDWVETVCYFGSQSTRDVIYVNATHLQCKIAAVDMSTQFSLSVSIDGGLKRVGSVNLTVFHRAPNVTTAKFSETAAEILVQFNKEVEILGVGTCSNLFENATVTKLGESPECSLVNTQELEISLGNGATILVGANMVFKDGVVKARGEPFSRFLSGSFQVNSPESPLKPAPQITGPETISSCGNLTLSGYQSYGGGGRALTFSWSLKSPNSGQDATAISNILSGLGNADRILIPGTEMTAGRTYEFQLGVANFLSPSTFKNVTHSVVKAAEPVPSLTLSSSIDLDEGEVYVSDDLSIKATAVVAPCVNDTGVNFMWTVTCTDASAQQKVESSSSFQITRTQATISIKEGVLTVGVTCTFNVTGRMNYNPNVKSSAAAAIKALPTPLEPAIVGGDRQVGRDSGTIKLDAMSQTVDPDNSSRSLTCKWKCADENNTLCYSAVNKAQLIFASLSGCKLEVQSTHFTAGKTYKISVDITKGSRIASVFIFLNVVEGNPPKVSVGEATIKAVAHKRVTLEGFYETNVEPTKVEWSCVQEQGFSYVDLSTLTSAISSKQYFAGEESYAFLTLPEGVLKKGSKYRFKLTVNDGSKEGVAKMVVEVRSGPTSGSLAVNKNTVEALFDEVTISAPRWTVGADATPLRYSFGKLVDNDVCEVWGSPSDSPEWIDILPPGSGSNNILTLCVIVEDKYESIAMATYNITSNPPDVAALTPDALDDLFVGKVEAQLKSGNLDKALSAMGSIADTVKGSSGTSDALKRNISQKAQEFIFDYLDSTVIGDDNAVPLLTALVKTDAAAAQNSSNMAGAAVKILDGLGDNPLNDNQAGDFLTWVGDLAGDSFDDNDEAFKDNMIDVFEELADNLGAKLVLGDLPREVSDDRLGVVKVQVSTLQQELTFSSKPGAPKCDPGAALAAQFGAPRKCAGGKMCSGVVVGLKHYKDNLITPDPSKQDSDVVIDNSQVVSFQISDPTNKKKITVKDLSTPLKLKFSVDQAAVPEGKQVKCKYFDAAQKAWVEDGLNAVGPVDGKLTCESTHATFFAPSQDGKNASTNITTTATPATTVGAKPEEKKNDHTGAIVGGVIGGLVFIVLVIVGIWWCSKKKKENSGRISPESPPGANA